MFDYYTVKGIFSIYIKELYLYSNSTTPRISAEDAPT